MTISGVTGFSNSGVSGFTAASLAQQARNQAQAAPTSITAPLTQSQNLKPHRYNGGHGAPPVPGTIAAHSAPAGPHGVNTVA